MRVTVDKIPLVIFSLGMESYGELSNRFLWCTTWCRVHYFAKITVNVLAIVLASLFLSMQMCVRLGWTNRFSCAVDHGTHNFSIWVFQICRKKRHRSCRFHLVIFSLGIESYGELSNRFLWCTTWCRVNYFTEITVNVLAIVLASL